MIFFTIKLLVAIVLFTCTVVLCAFCMYLYHSVNTIYHKVGTNIHMGQLKYFKSIFWAGYVKRSTIDLGALKHFNSDKCDSSFPNNSIRGKTVFVVTCVLYIHGGKNLYFSVNFQILD